MKPEILKYLEYKYDIIKVITETDNKKLLLLQDKQTGEYCRYKRINRRIDVFDKLKKLKSEYLPEIFYLHYDGNETIVIEEEIQGKTLGELLDERKLFTEKECEYIFISLCNVLKLLHKNGILHRDLKPDNIMLAGGKLKLIDFDASRELKADTLSDTVLLGTKGFAPPEQYGFSQTDYRSDIYSLGVTMQLISGKRSKYKRIIKKCVSFAPKDRYKTVNAVKRAIYLRKYKGMFVFAALTTIIIAFALNTYYNDPVFRDDILLVMDESGIISLTEEQKDRVFAREDYNKDEIKEIWSGEYKSADGSELEILYNKSLQFSLVTYDNDIKANLVGGKLELVNLQTAEYTTSAPKGIYKITMYIYNDGVFISENDIPSPYGRLSIVGYYEKSE